MRIIVPGGRAVWAIGGSWERFFILAPNLCVIYLLSLVVVVLVDPHLYSDPKMPFALPLLLTLMFSFLILVDVWATPLVFSSRVIRAWARKEEFKADFQRNERAITMLVSYLDSLGHGGRWLEGNLLSLSYFVIFLAWGLIAYRFPQLTGIENGLLVLATFMIPYVASVFLQLWLFRRSFNRMVADAALKGFPFAEARPL